MMEPHLWHQQLLPSLNVHPYPKLSFLLNLMLANSKLWIIFWQLYRSFMLGEEFFPDFWHSLLILITNKLNLNLVTDKVGYFLYSQLICRLKDKPKIHNIKLTISMQIMLSEKNKLMNVKNLTRTRMLNKTSSSDLLN